MSIGDDRLYEWREQIGVRIMHSMTCTHKGDDFGDRAVCKTCFDNAQSIGALMEAQVKRAYKLAEAEFMHAGQCSQMCEDHPETCPFAYPLPIAATPNPESEAR